MNIDWSKAPTWATHFIECTDAKFLQAFFAVESEDRYTMVGAQTFFRKRDEGRPGWIVTARPVTTWNGEGLPPVGLECETLWSSTTGEYVSVLVVGHDGDRAVVRFTSSDRKGEYDSDRQHNEYGRPIFRPLRTVEERAEEALREKYMPKLQQLWDADTRHEEFLEAVLGLLRQASVK